MLPEDIVNYIINEFQPHLFYKRKFSTFLDENIKHKFHGKCGRCSMSLNGTFSSKVENHNHNFLLID
jgi:hypothetical protein